MLTERCTISSLKRELREVRTLALTRAKADPTPENVRKVQKIDFIGKSIDALIKRSQVLDA